MLATPADVEPTVVVRLPAPRIHLNFLDAIRGLAALYVLAFHTLFRAFTTALEHHDTIPTWLTLMTGWMSYGKYAVVVFIVLSGYCLMLPVARSTDGRLRGGIGAFIKRRARRILPPYYASIFMAWVLTLLLHHIKVKASMEQHDFLHTEFNAAVLGSHLLLVHNMRVAWMERLNMALWSVALEWQIYFLFALLLLPLYRRFGTLTVVGVALVLGLAPHFLLPAGQNFDWTLPWFIALFAFGMAGAVINFSEKPVFVWLRTRLARPPVISALFLGYLVCFYVLGWGKDDHNVAVRMHLILGIVTTAAIVLCTRSRIENKFPVILGLVRFLECRPLLLLGAFSYSLYLTHGLIVPKINNIMERFYHAPVIYTVLFFTTSIVCSLGLAYLFYSFFERPFTSSST